MLADKGGDNNGGISIEEMTLLLKRLGLNMTKHMILEMFANCLEDTQSIELNRAEFAKAIKYIHDYKTQIGLEKMNLTSGHLIRVYLLLLGILILLLIFILVGVTSFTTGGVFNAIITSILPFVAGVGVSNANTENDQPTMMKIVENLIPNIKKQINSESSD